MDDFFIVSSLVLQMQRGRRPFTLQYHGQLDDSRPSNGVPVTGSDLRKAITCVLTGQKVDSSQKPSIGCNIKWCECPLSQNIYFLVTGDRSVRCGFRSFTCLIILAEGDLQDSGQRARLFC